MLILITGAARNGKSKYAVELAARYHKKCLLVTSQALDNKVKIRIHNHQKENNKSFATHKAPVHLASALLNLQNQFELILIDSLHSWMSNLLVQYMNVSEDTIQQEVEWFLQALQSTKADVIMVTQETSAPRNHEDASALRLNQELRRVNQKVAELSSEVFFMIGGVPNEIKKSILDDADVEIEA